jgi:SAM-dependent methyltransferase
MNFKKNVLDLLREKSKLNAESDQYLRLEIDKEIMQSKPQFLKVIFDIQQQMVDEASPLDSSIGINLELGAGVLPMKLNHPKIRSTDIVPSTHLDGVLDATNLELDDNSIQNIFLQNTFHHLPNPQEFFNESLRVLKNGGRVIIVDPYFNLISSFLYPRLFTTETFQKNGTWTDASDHAMIGANQALSYIVFKRDIEIFSDSNPNLRIVTTRPLNSGMRYLLTGGLNFKQLVPNFCLEFIRTIEKVFVPSRVFGIHWIIVLEKTANSEKFG